MEGGALFNQGYLGQGFNWWIGQIADDSTWRENVTSGKFKNKQTPKGWGYRYKVRIFGFHDLGEEAIESKNLPWANIMYPVTAGGYQTNSGQTPNIRQGNIVFGFFLDGKEQQTPVIMGVLGNNVQTLLATAIGDSRVTNTKNGSVATSGYAKGQKPAKPEETPTVGDSDKGVEKPKSTEQQQEEAPAPSGVGLNKYGLPADRPITKAQLADIRSAKHEAEEKELTWEDADKLIRKRVAAGVANRAKEANSPRSPVQPGATIESEAVHLQTAANLKLDAVYCKKRVMLKPTSLVESANKAMQIDMDNMTQLIDKSMNALTSYTDAVSRTREMGNLKKIISDGSKTQSKYMKIIMDNVMEYTQKKLNKEMTSAVSALPMSQRYKMLDLKDVMTQNILENYNGITGGMGGLMEGILNKMLKLDELTDAFEKSVLDDSDSSSDPTKPKPLKGKPKVPTCASEDMVAAVLAANKVEIDKTNEDIINGMDNFIGDIQSQVAGVSGSMASLLSGLGSIKGNLTSALSFKNITANVFPFELPPNEAVSDYYTLCSGGAGQTQTQLPNFSAISEATNLADRVIPDKEDKPGFATIPKNTQNVNLIQTASRVVDVVDDVSDALDIA